MQLRNELREKEMKLTDIRLEALSSAHQLDQLREAMNHMQVWDWPSRYLLAVPRIRFIGTITPRCFLLQQCFSLFSSRKDKYDILSLCGWSDRGRSRSWRWKMIVWSWKAKAVGAGRPLKCPSITRPWPPCLDCLNTASTSQSPPASVRAYMLLFLVFFPEVCFVAICKK